ncbi:MAG: S-layer homology domain-containing protein [Candidatus Peribacteraceae bacterium]|nr:S-layer homology domain-containing protein [Candidatus Peribacteraceae bacterium]
MDTVGKWTLLQPNHESLERTDAALTLTNLRPGLYSFFASAPEGTTAHVDVMLGDDSIASADSPQISFELKDTMTLKIAIKYSLTIFGKVGVGSDPLGVPFEMRGPNGMTRSGTTPMEYSPSPIGNYSVTYKPTGCPQPPIQAGLLQKEDRVNFMIVIVCDGFVPHVTEEKSKTVVTELGGKTTTFDDVPTDSWFGPFISTIVSRGIMGGYTDSSGNSTGKFGPGDPVTVAQLAKISHTVVKLNHDEVKSAPLNPLSRGQWFTRFMASAEERGWSVYVDGTVDPNRPATRGEVVATLLQVLDISVQWPHGDKFTDVLRKTPYAGAVETAASEEIVAGSTNADGTPTGLFHPGDPITRAEIAKMLIAIREKYQVKNDAE